MSRFAPRFRAQALAAALTGCALAACGQSASPASAGSSSAAGGNSSSSAPASDPADHPCDFVTQAEAEAIMGSPIASPHVGVAGGCNYSASDQTTKETIVHFNAGERDRSDYDHSKSLLKDPQDVSGVGDAATCETITAPVVVASLFVYSGKGKRLFSIVGDACDQDKQFALKVLSRL
ncbi:MAG: hypothetical protein JF887_05135 [Candidatus Dormibacteraeota bacterium]|uniref:DUF3558 domain-containing protein n=1 Tax=Candidatus Amunia macphersoniae TaxID=3127014 RepID=A0A934KMP4_9BACT|nr:hypothetical protein [Candidatus Dormibacteraeota bacterium]